MWVGSPPNWCQARRPRAIALTRAQQRQEAAVVVVGTGGEEPYVLSALFTSLCLASSDCWNSASLRSGFSGVSMINREIEVLRT